VAAYIFCAGLLAVSELPSYVKAWSEFRMTALTTALTDLAKKD